jgi:cobalt-zinc-cadmium efflux system membrane fusion protein
MPERAGVNLQSRVQLLANLLVLVFLVGLGVWGHRHHWQIRRDADTTSDSPAEKNLGRLRENSPAERSATEPMRLEASQEVFHESGDQQIVRFRTSAAVQQAGIRVESAQIKEMAEYVAANGVIGYDETRLAQLSSHVPGIAWRVEKHVGDQVHKGEVLAILDAIEVGNAKARFLEATIDYDVKSHNMRKLEEISSSISARALRDAQADTREARIRRYNTRQTLINLGLPPPHELAANLPDEELIRKIQFLGIPEHIVAELDPATATANLLPIVAPFDGVLIRSEIVIGEVVQTANHQFVMADISRMWIKLNVKKTDAIRLAIGQEVRFQADGVAGEIDSEVSWIGTEVDEKTRSVQVRTVVGNPVVSTSEGIGHTQRLLRAHTFGSARIRVRERRPTVVVPQGAIQWDGNRHMVFVALPDGLSFARRTVIPGATDEANTEIISGVAADEPVVAAGSYVLKSELGRTQAASNAP